MIFEQVQPMLSIVCVFNSATTLAAWLGPSVAEQSAPVEFISVDNTNGRFSSAASALNFGAATAHGKYVAFVHQDVHFQDAAFVTQLIDIIESIPDLGVGGTVGAIVGQKSYIGAITSGKLPGKVPHSPMLPAPQRAQTLDEHFLVLRRELFSSILFDEITCASWDLYGADLCLVALERGLRNYVLPLTLHHESYGRLKWNYAVTLEKVRRKHRSHVRRIATCCGEWSTSIDGRIQFVLHKGRSARTRFCRRFFRRGN